MDKLTKARATELSSQSLAFVGDAVFSLYVRENLCKSIDCKSAELTKRANGFVNATAQSAMMERLSPVLTAEEQDVVRRARNTRTNNKAKSATLINYKRATALEALLGFLYLTGQSDRLAELENICFLKAEHE